MWSGQGEDARCPTDNDEGLGEGSMTTAPIARERTKSMAPHVHHDTEIDSARLAVVEARPAVHE